MHGDKIISALIGLVGAVSNNGKTDNTDSIVRDAFLQLKDCENEEDIQRVVHRLHKEKYAIAPDCRICQNPCGNTSDYDLSRFYDADEHIRSVKERLIETIYTNLSLSDTVSELVYRGIAYIGFDLGEEAYDKIICDLLKERKESIDLSN